MDYEAGKPLETDVLLKAPVELARLVGVPAPNLQTVHSLIDLLTRPLYRSVKTGPITSAYLALQYF
jgi:ketopantoate reductase